MQALLRDILRPSQATRYCLFKAGEEGEPGGRDILRPSQATQYCLFKAGGEERTVGLTKGAPKKHLQVIP